MENYKGQLVSLRYEEGVLEINNQVMRNDVVYVAQSFAIKEWGLFAARDIKKGELFLRYEGDMVHEAELSGKVKNTGYLLAVPHHWPYIGIDAYPYVRAGALQRLAAFANHASVGNAAPHLSSPTLLDDIANELVVVQPIVHLRAQRDIKKGEEILWDYGAEHWVDRDAQPVDIPSQNTLALSIMGKHHHDDAGDEKKHKKRRLPRLSKKKIEKAKKGAKKAGKVAKVVAPLVLL